MQFTLAFSYGAQAWHPTRLLLRSLSWPKTKRRTGINPGHSTLCRASRTNFATSSLLTDNQLNVITKSGAPDPDVWAIGDAAMIQDQRLPATAQGHPFHHQ
jgi:hypothetical protein